MLLTTSARYAVAALNFSDEFRLIGAMAACALMIVKIIMIDSTARTTAYCQNRNDSAIQTETIVVVIGTAVKMRVSQNRSTLPMSFVVSETVPPLMRSA
ncbi:hypothetical protein D9M68_829730 [compost metagenome]